MWLIYIRLDVFDNECELFLQMVLGGFLANESADGFCPELHKYASDNSGHPGGFPLCLQKRPMRYFAGFGAYPSG